MRRSVALLLVFALFAAACGDDGGDDDASDGDTTPSSIDLVEEEALTPAEDDPALDAVTVTGEAGEDPEISIDGELSVDETVRRLLVEGDGTEVEEGATVTFHFEAVNGRTGEAFDASRPGEAPAVSIDPAQLLPGLYRALLEVPEGSRVLAALTPDDAFGPQGGFAELSLEADDTLVFVIDVQSVQVPLERAEGTTVQPAEGLPAVTLDDDGAPTIELPEGDPPGELVAQVLIEGEGAEVEAGQQLTAHYTGITWPRGEQFDSSWERGEPATFPIGTGGVIAGWDEGLVGKTIGSQVLLVIPPDKGYGAEGNPQAGIQGTDHLVFVVDLLAAG